MFKCLAKPLHAFHQRFNHQGSLVQTYCLSRPCSTDSRQILDRFDRVFLRLYIARRLGRPGPLGQLHSLLLSQPELSSQTVIPLENPEDGETVCKFLQIHYMSQEQPHRPWRFEAKSIEYQCRNLKSSSFEPRSNGL